MNHSIFHKKPLAFVLALALSLSLGACVGRPEPSDLSSSSEEELPVRQEYVFVNPLREPDRPIKGPKLVEAIGEKNKINSDTVGWLKIPGTHIDDVVLHYDDPDDFNNYYYRLDFNKNYSFNGCFYVDFRNKFGTGKRDELGNNTVIYGHTMSANINGVMFAPLKYFEQEEFAKATPYIFFSTEAEDLVWEVFSVFYATIDLPYNLAGQTEKEFEKLLKECTDRSLFQYDTKVTGKDKVLTLSTCTYSAPGVQGSLGYPNNYRYVVMAKQISKVDATKTEATFTVNPNPKAP